MKRVTRATIVAMAVVTIGSSTTAADLDGFTTRDIEPGVQRVVADGAGHRFAFGGGRRSRPAFDAIASGQADAPYVLSHRDPDGRHGQAPWPAKLWHVGTKGASSVDVPSALSDVAIGPDGTVWVAGEGRFLARFDGDEFEIVRRQRGFAPLLGLSVGADGSVWGAWRDISSRRADRSIAERFGELIGLSGGDGEDSDRQRTRAVRLGASAAIARFDGEEWVDVLGEEWVDAGGRSRPFKLTATPDGALYAGIGPDGSLARYDGSAWTLEWPLGPEREHSVHALAVAPDDALWALVETPSTRELRLARRGVEGWALHGADALPQCVSPWLQGDGERDEGRYMEVGPDGTVWLLHAHRGIVAFDGETSHYVLDEFEVTDLTVDQDGHAWVFADDRRDRSADLYRIDPNALRPSSRRAICPDGILNRIGFPEPPRRGPSLEQVTAELERNERLWAATRPDAYSYAIQRRCFCFERGPVRISVDGTDSASQVYVESGLPVPADLRPYPDVDGLFGLIRQAVFLEAVVIDVTYDPEFGVPMVVDIDYLSNTVDEELGYTVIEPVAPS